ncbi:hypothetical protein VFPBJ_00054 [Purpureocillium lilacinum]|uniref:Uncharacterized protein n=1 Tax=Purpureocillium lilacinum TaxID=33203 RepID=A0A179H780_PURLI|nr:hypothetical protein VFPBJ_00054 [Purpureocillium lilacinum]
MYVRMRPMQEHVGRRRWPGPDSEGSERIAGWAPTRRRASACMARHGSMDGWMFSRPDVRLMDRQAAACCGTRPRWADNSMRGERLAAPYSVFGRFRRLRATIPSRQYFAPGAVKSLGVNDAQQLNMPAFRRPTGLGSST